MLFLKSLITHPIMQFSTTTPQDLLYVRPRPWSNHGFVIRGSSLREISILYVHLCFYQNESYAIKSNAYR